VKNVHEDPPHLTTDFSGFRRKTDRDTSGVTRLGRMKRGSGIKGRDDRSSGIEIRKADALAKINPTDPLIVHTKFFFFPLKKNRKQR
jgi:hypothetical protein